MATLALAAAFSAFPGGTFIGAFVGGVIDNFLLYPALFPAPDVTGPRLDALQRSSAAEGVPVRWTIGPLVRVPGQVIWLGPREEVKRELDLGGFSGSGPASFTFEYFQSLAVSFGRVTPGSSLYTRIQAVRKLMADTKILWNNGALAKYDDITWYYGDQTAPDPLMESVLGAGNVPNYSFEVFCVIERLALDEFGVGRVPNLMGLIQQDNDLSLQDALKLIIERAGLDPVNDVNFDRLPFCFRGMNLDGPTSTLDAVRMISGIYGVSFQARGGKIYAFATGDEDTFTVGSDFGTDTAPTATVEHVPVWDAPTSAEVRYVRWETDAQPGLEPYHDQTRSSDTGNKVSVSVPITLKSDEAQAVAKRIVWTAIAERKSIEEFILPPSYYFLKAGDALILTLDGRTLTMLCSDVTHGANYHVAVSGRSYNPLAYAQTGVGVAEGYTGNSTYEPPATELVLLDMASPFDDFVSGPGLFWAVRPSPATAQFKGAILYSSLDDADYAEAGVVGNAASIGQVVEYSGIECSAIFYDEVNHFTVAMDSGVLTSATKNEVLRGERNGLAVQAPDGDWELLAFVTVTDAGLHTDGRQQYRLTGLLRGRRGTEQLVNSHLAHGARVVVFQANSTVAFWDYDDSSFLGNPTFLKAPSLGGALDDFTPRRVVPQGRNAAPFAPSGMRWRLQAEAGAARDVYIYWQDRGKRWTDPMALAPAQADDELQQWSVEIRIGGPLSGLLLSVPVTEPFFNFDQVTRTALALSNPFGWAVDNSFTVHVRKQTSTGPRGRRADLGVSR